MKIIFEIHFACLENLCLILDLLETMQ